MQKENAGEIKEKEGLKCLIVLIYLQYLMILKCEVTKSPPCSGMCSFCTADCAGTCEIGLSAVLGKSIVYPTNTGNNQVAAEKDYPID